ncbi:hypothetical protein B7P43_G16164 [Cryptotermes secundus]|uniref:BZIP domain-containing protein n=2 Tax=Cryptotermes secundus TaxID=105785 RepID=A0A2J7R4G8_9NEOP|nr:hypothetical protein B7P43_G16164 [Cryptotermes secundus]PNF35731.1 hypothetical protein B7P43_G16164 [Cryptotermes secundus]PNF35732.1 hypothetical protein B7P43_G16164 [Cryptotermes secundus]PNF35733.1 hypothetical protein B7P43_G16164 [Cryptotermes secundus]PNF35734.1 hypothetical protein B7P43_G16164 [Cryptotermes secundus]
MQWNDADSELKNLLLSNETRGHPEILECPSTSCSRSQKRKLSTSIASESLTPAKRSRMPSVNHTCDRYRERRDRNNEASRKCRENGKAREREMKELTAKLEGENESLKKSVDELEELVKKLREALFEAMVKIGQEASPKMGIDSPRDEQQNKRFCCGSEVFTFSPPGAAHDG